MSSILGVLGIGGSSAGTAASTAGTAAGTAGSTGAGLGTAAGGAMGGGQMAAMPGMTGQLAAGTGIGTGTGVGGMGTAAAAGTAMQPTGMMGMLKSTGQNIMSRYGLNQTPKTTKDWGEFAQGMTNLTDDWSTMQKATGEDKPKMELKPATLQQRQPQPIQWAEEELPGLKGMLQRPGMFQ